MPSEPTGETALSEACPLCGRPVAAGDTRAANVRVRPLGTRGTVGFTAHWPCLAAAFDPIRRRTGAVSLWADWFNPPAA
jgi:hypothetical protein